MAAPSGFSYVVRGNGDVVVLHRGNVATTLRSARAVAFLADVGDGDSDADQELMARVTGNYKRGNERLAGQHPRNRENARRTGRQ